MDGCSSLIPTRRAALAVAVAVLALGAAACGDDGTSAPGGTAAADFACAPTPRGEAFAGADYQADAPVRSKVGDGYLLIGRVLSAIDCEPLAQARVEVWLVAPDGGYDDEHRATLPPVTKDGGYRFESNRPVGYSRYGEDVPPHIHVRVSAPGHKSLRVEHYPTAGASQARFDLVLTG